jgi:hypothetical protein
MPKLSLLWISFLTLLTLTNVHAQTPRCLNLNQVREVQADFQIEAAPEVDSKLQPCESDPLTYRVYQAILFLKNLPPLTVRLDRFDQGILTATPYEYLKERIQTIRFESDSNANCQNGTVAAYISSKPAIMHICSGSKDGDLLVLAATLIHEARHTQDYPHTSFCTHGSFSGGVFGGCDARYSDRGAYAIEAEFLIRLSRTMALPESIRNQARNLATVTLLENINETPFHVRPGYFLQDQSGEISFFDGSAREHLIQLENADDLFLLRTQIPTVYNFETGEVFSYLNSNAKAQTPGVYAETFRKTASERERRELLDVAYHKLMSCTLYRDHLACNYASAELDIRLESIVPSSLTVLADQIALVDQNGYAYPIFPQAISRLDFTEASLSPTSRSIGVISLAEESLRVHFGVDNDGRIRRYTALGDPEQPGELVTELSQSRFKKIIGPVWWSSEVSTF